MKHWIFFLIVAAIILPVSAENLEIIKNGRSRFAICAEPDRISQEDAALLCSYLMKSGGVKLEIVTEDRLGERPAVYIGAAAAKKRMQPNERFRRFYWEHRIETDGKNLYIYGNDGPGKLRGTRKGVLEFLERFAGVAAIAPGRGGISVIPQSGITVPDNFHFRCEPWLRFNVSHSKTLGQDSELYEIANNLFPVSWYSYSGSHTHGGAIPAALFKTHPEYFAMTGGKRRLQSSDNWHNNYCFSNPEVRRRLMADTRRRLQKASEIMIQLGQNDGIKPCECAECRRLYADITPGELLWKIHREIAMQMNKEFPEKKLHLIAYGDTGRPPRTFTSFPGNVEINLAPCTPEILQNWKTCQVPGGFNAYLYNWGWYKNEGFTPKLSFSALKRQAKMLKESGVAGIYRCDFGELFGLEGPSYYIWGKLLLDPDRDEDKLLENYCRHAFGNAAEKMTEFYRYLNRLLEKEILGYHADMDFNDLSASSDPRAPMKLLAARYQENEMKELEGILKQAEALESELEFMKVVRIEFDYLKYTAGAARAAQKLGETLEKSDCDVLFSALEQRKKFIETLPCRTINGKTAVGDLGAFRLFANVDLKVLADGGRLFGRWRAPLNWDAAYYRQNRLYPVGRKISADRQRQLLVQRNYEPVKAVVRTHPTYVSCHYKEGRLRVIFECVNSSGNDLLKEEFWVHLGQKGERMRFTGRPHRGAANHWVRVKRNQENQGEGDLYKLTDKKVSIAVHGNQVEFVIPLTEFHIDPALPLEFNATRLGIVSVVWEYNLDQKTYKNCTDKLGVLAL